MEKRLSILSLSLFLFFAVGCNRATDPQNSETESNALTDNGGRNTPEELQTETNVDDDAIGFMKKAAHASTMEVEFGKVAQEKAQNPRVKSFAEMMVRDHTTTNKALLQLGTAKNVIINVTMTPEHKKHLEEMKKLSGAAFDQHYMNMMVNDHAKDIKEFELAADNRDPEVNQFANKTLTVLRSHLDSAKAIHASLPKQ